MTDATGAQSRNVKEPLGDSHMDKLQALATLARVDFWCFVELMFPVLHPGKPLIHAPYLEYIAGGLMMVEQGKRRRLLINLPPRHLKSILTSVLYPAWRLGRDPSTGASRCRFCPPRPRMGRGPRAP